MPAMKIECPKHGEVEFNGTGDFIDDELPITVYCPACVGEEQTARYNDYVKCVKEKNPNWKPLQGRVRPRKPQRGGE